ncbi:unnamed protein product [Spirodela intermedia]|uniref:Long-chain-alcohol oxidase n=1 Tax=Spirodela intermedia TaxID=51605 RepID=A0A7I8L8S6_SPIIN|nr:unnamed protein product [Spirodela intermedia]
MEEKSMLNFSTAKAEVTIDLDDLQEGTGVHQRPPPINTLSARQMESLIAICDALLPSIDLPAADNDSIRKFFGLSASLAGTPEMVGAYICGRLQHITLDLLKLTLWFLSTWYGTFAICGMKSLSGRFPYFRRLSEVPRGRREEILLSWSSSPLRLLRLLFRSLKTLVLLIYFTQVNEKGENPTWKAIGYCGPDPDFVRQLVPAPEMPSKPEEKGSSPTSTDRTSRLGPLHPALVLLDRPPAAIAAALGRAGLSLSVVRCARRGVPTATIRCDVVVVGSGSGGGVVAGVLARAGHKVVVVERGQYHARQGLTLREGHAMDNMYEGSGLVGTDDLGVMILAGSTVGGGSAINWSASIRTPRHVMDEWCDAHGLELFGSDAYMEAMDAVCARMGVQSEVSEESLNNTVLRRGCAELGYPVSTIPRNCAGDHYCGWCCFGCKDGGKKGTSETWLLDMSESGNGVILPGCTAVKVLHRRQTGHRRPVATGVLVRFQGGRTEKMIVVESKVTVAACGALRTPQLLLHSGLRNANIGRHLHLHPVVMAWGHFPESPPSRRPDGEKKSYEGGIMTAMSTVVANFDSNGYGAIIQTPASHPGAFSALMPWTSGSDFKERMTRFSRTAHIFALARDQGSGDVRTFPESLEYKLDAGDEENLQGGVEKMLRILAAAGAEEIGTHHRSGERLNVKTATFREFEAFVWRAGRRQLSKQSTPVCSAHQMGSCRMGIDPRTSAVDPTGETWEMERLYVADTSTFPTALGVNPMVTVQTIAYCTAQSVLQVLRRSRKRKGGCNVDTGLC